MKLLARQRLDHFQSGVLPLAGNGLARRGASVVQSPAEETSMKNCLKVPAGAVAPARAMRERPMQQLLMAGCPDFWRLWSVGLVVFTVRWLETVAVGVFVYQSSHSAFLVALMTMLRLLPMGLLGAFIGAWAEKIERRITLVVVVMLMLTTSISLALLAYSGHLAIWHLAAASFLIGLGWAPHHP